MQKDKNKMPKIKKIKTYDFPKQWIENAYSRDINTIVTHTKSQIKD